MKTDEFTADRIVRIVIGVILAALAITGVATGALAASPGSVAAIALVTGVVGFCPLYAIFRVSTKGAAR